MYIVTPPECNNKLNMYLDSQLFLSFSKFLKHVFNIALKLQKLNNHSWKKYNIKFLCKKMTPEMSGFAVVKKARSHQKKIFEEKVLPVYFCK